MIFAVTGRSAADADRAARHGVQAAGADRFAATVAGREGATIEVPEGAGREGAEGPSGERTATAFARSRRSSRTKIAEVTCFKGPSRPSETE